MPILWLNIDIHLTDVCLETLELYYTECYQVSVHLRAVGNEVRQPRPIKRFVYPDQYASVVLARERINLFKQFDSVCFNADH